MGLVSLVSWIQAETFSCREGFKIPASEPPEAGTARLRECCLRFFESSCMWTQERTVELRAIVAC
jgi:hypothetical protein